MNLRVRRHILAALKCKVQKKVVPGDVLRLEVSIEKLKRNAGIGVGTAYVGDKVAAQAEIIFMIG